MGEPIPLLAPSPQRKFWVRLLQQDLTTVSTADADILPWPHHFHLLMALVCAAHTVTSVVIASATSTYDIPYGGTEIA